jgi:hypothetical protein
LSARRNAFDLGGTGGIIAKDPANPEAGYRLNVARNPETGNYRLMAPLQFKSIGQVEVLMQLPGNLNPAQIPFMGGLYPSLEVRTMDYKGANAGYFNVWPSAPAQREAGPSDIVLQRANGSAIELTPRQVSLLQEGILDPALFSEAGGTGIAKLMRTFEAVPLIPGTAIQNANDPFTDYVPGHQPNEPRRLRTDFEFGVSATVTPLAGVPGAGVFGGALAPLSKFVPLGFTPFRAGAGGVIKFDIFPTQPQVSQLVTADTSGAILKSEPIPNTTNSNAQSITRLRVPPEQQGSAASPAAQTISIDVPSLAFLPFTGAKTWRPESRDAVMSFLNGTQADNRTQTGQVADPAVEAAVDKAYAVFGRQPISGLRLISEDQTAALRQVIQDMISRAQRNDQEASR